LADHIKVVAGDEVPAPSTVDGSWSAERVTKINDYLYKIEGLSIENTPGQSTINLAGEHFLGAYNYYYWHFIHEDLAYYEGLKLDIPNLKLTLIDLAHLMQDENSLRAENVDTYPYLTHFVRMYPQDLYLTSETNIRIEVAYFTPTSGDVFRSTKLFSSRGLYPLSMQDCPEYLDWSGLPWDLRGPYGGKGIQELSKKLKLSVQVGSDSPKKIFISRKDVNSRLRKYVGSPEYEHLLQERLFDDEFLESYFVEQGYVSVALEDLKYVDQVRLFIGATHVAGTVGAGFSNLHLCSPGTKLIELHVLPHYGFDYEYYSRVSGIDYKFVDLRDLENTRTLSVEDMKKILSDVDL